MEREQTKYAFRSGDKIVLATKAPGPVRLKLAERASKQMIAASSALRTHGMVLADLARARGDERPKKIYQKVARESKQPPRMPRMAQPVAPPRPVFRDDVYREYMGVPIEVAPVLATLTGVSRMVRSEHKGEWGEPTKFETEEDKKKSKRLPSSKCSSNVRLNDIAQEIVYEVPKGYKYDPLLPVD